MDYITYLKKYDNYDKYILYLLSLGMNIKDTAEAAMVSRETVYQVIKRNQDMVKEYPDAVQQALQEAVKEPEDDADIQAESPDTGRQARA